jgi:hypothetical protein
VPVVQARMKPYFLNLWYLTYNAGNIMFSLTLFGVFFLGVSLLLSLFVN